MCCPKWAALGAALSSTPFLNMRKKRTPRNKALNRERTERKRKRTGEEQARITTLKFVTANSRSGRSGEEAARKRREINRSREEAVRNEARENRKKRLTRSQPPLNGKYSDQRYFTA